MGQNFNQILYEMSNLDFSLGINPKQDIVLKENEIASLRKTMNTKFKTAIFILND